MENAFGRVASVLALAIAVFIAPLYMSFQKADYMRSIMVTVKTTELVDAVRNTGQLTRDMYDNYSRSLSGLGLVCDIQMEHKRCGLYGNDNVWISTTGEEIREKLYSEEKYDFMAGDYFKIIVYDSSKKTVISYYGGSVRNERT